MIAKSFVATQHAAAVTLSAHPNSSYCRCPSITLLFAVALHLRHYFLIISQRFLVFLLAFHNIFFCILGLEKDIFLPPFHAVPPFPRYSPWSKTISGARSRSNSRKSSLLVPVKGQQCKPSPRAGARRQRQS